MVMPRSCSSSRLSMYRIWTHTHTYTQTIAKVCTITVRSICYSIMYAWSTKLKLQMKCNWKLGEWVKAWRIRITLSLSVNLTNSPNTNLLTSTSTWPTLKTNLTNLPGTPPPPPPNSFIQVTRNKKWQKLQQKRGKKRTGNCFTS